MCRRDRNEDLLYKLFGKKAELLIDHAWGWEPTTIGAIKVYRPSSNSLSSGQVLHCPYEPQKAKLVVREMTEDVYKRQAYICGSYRQRTKDCTMHFIKTSVLWELILTCLLYTSRCV